MAVQPGRHSHSAGSPAGSPAPALGGMGADAPGAPGQDEQREQRAQQDEAKRQMLSQILDSNARERCGCAAGALA